MQKQTCAIVAIGKTKSREEILTLLNAAIAEGCTHFLSGLEYGSGLDAAEAVLLLRETHPEITLECAIPYEEYTTMWDEASRDRYFDIIRRCDIERLLQTCFVVDCMDWQQAYLSQNADKTLEI